MGKGLEDDIASARHPLIDRVEKDERVLKDRGPTVLVNSLDDSSVGMGLRVWTQSSNYVQPS